ncbi:hypothetical protein BJY01DRAFT_222670 [Aspergillus pseudoustus]|uniref:Uncharacterized protein n=1 Tax=Aspergillus pseudoustus TaxID=1810923 RepID=A0ABR4J7L1_9EURO
MPTSARVGGLGSSFVLFQSLIAGEFQALREGISAKFGGSGNNPGPSRPACDDCPPRAIPGQHEETCCVTRTWSSPRRSNRCSLDNFLSRLKFPIYVIALPPRAL